MGQRNSTTITNPYETIDSIEPNEWTNYMEWTNFKNLKKGEKYRLIIECYEFELIFCYYAYRGKYGYHENCDAIFKDTKCVIQQIIILNIIIHIKKRIQIKSKRQIR